MRFGMKGRRDALKCIQFQRKEANSLSNSQSDDSGYSHTLSLSFYLPIIPFSILRFATNTPIAKHIQIFVHCLHFLLLLSLLLPRRFCSSMRHRLLQHLQHRMRRNRHRARIAQSHAILPAMNDRIRNFVENRFCVACDFHGVCVAPLREEVTGRTENEPVNLKIINTL